MNTHLVNDLTTHAMERIGRVMMQKLDLLDTDAEKAAFMVTVLASMLASAADALALKLPHWDGLSENDRLFATMAIIGSATGVDGPADQSAVQRAVSQFRCRHVLRD